MLIHGGPGSFDHSYFKPEFARLRDVAQVMYLDLRGHGRSEWGEPADWSYEVCADDVRALCDRLEIADPIVYGHSMGGFITMLYGVRHPGHAGALVLQSTHARYDLERLVEGFRRVGGDDIADIAERAYDGLGRPVTTEEWARAFAVFGPRVPDAQELARIIKNPGIGPKGNERFRAFDVVDRLDDIACPTLVCVGDLDPVTPVEASREVFEALADGVGELAVIEGAGHFAWKDEPDRYWDRVLGFVRSLSRR